MKVVIAISSSFSANFIKGQGAFLKENGIEVVVVSAIGPEVTSLAREENIRFVEIPFCREISLYKDLKSFIKVLNFIIREKPDIVNAGNPKTGFLFMLARIFFPKRIMVFTLRGLRSDTLIGMKKNIVKFTEKISCSLAKRVIVISPSLMEHAIAIGVLPRNKGIVLGKGSSNGVDTTKYRVTIENSNGGIKLRQSLGIKESDFVVGFVGRITKDKGIEELYYAFKLCQESFPDFKMILVGPIEMGDPISNEVLRLIKNDDNIFLLGKIYDLPPVYASIDILVLYSHREGFGNVAIEASAMGKPTIVSDIPGCKDTTVHFQTGLVVESHNIMALSESILFYKRNPELKLIHGQNGISRIRNFFSSEFIRQEQLNLYNSLMAFKS